MKTSLEKYRGYWVRPGTMDKYIVNELSFYKRLALTAKDRVLDIGGCIGTYALHAAQQGAQVFTVEPVAANVALLRRNVPGLASNGAIFHAAAVPDSYRGASIVMYVSAGPNKGSHTTVPTRGRQQELAPVARWSDLLAGQPTVIKMDCEGAEYDLLGGKPLPRRVRAFLIEYHLQKKGQREAARCLHDWFLQQGFHTTKAPSLHSNAWHTTAIYER